MPPKLTPCGSRIERQITIGSTNTATATTVRKCIWVYPRFVQYDIRKPDHLADYDQVVMQFGAPKDMMWGDVGEACFLMRREDLKNRAFDKAIYNWDCS